MQGRHRLEVGRRRRPSARGRAKLVPRDPCAARRGPRGRNRDPRRPPQHAPRRARAGRVPPPLLMRHFQRLPAPAGGRGSRATFRPRLYPGEGRVYLFRRIPRLSLPGPLLDSPRLSPAAGGRMRSPFIYFARPPSMELGPCAFLSLPSEISARAYGASGPPPSCCRVPAHVRRLHMGAIGARFRPRCSSSSATAAATVRMAPPEVPAAASPRLKVQPLLLS